MEVFTMLTLAALVVKIVSTIKNVGKDNNAAITQVLVWVVGIVILFLASEAEITENLEVFEGSGPLGDLDAASIILAGLALASFGAFGYDVKKAIDGTDSAAEPALLPPKHTT